jgi:hypothetical protein
MITCLTPEMNVTFLSLPVAVRLLVRLIYRDVRYADVILLYAQKMDTLVCFQRHTVALLT